MILRAAQEAVAAIEAVIIDQMFETGSAYHLVLMEGGDVVSVQFLGATVWDTEEFDSREAVSIATDIRKEILGLVATLSKIDFSKKKKIIETITPSEMVRRAVHWEEIGSADSEGIEGIMGRFPFDKVQLAMEITGWKWHPGVPNVEELRQKAHELLSSATSKVSCCSGGFKVSHEGDMLRLEFPAP